jgi:cell wall hydrolase
MTRQIRLLGLCVLLACPALPRPAAAISAALSSHCRAISVATYPQAPRTSFGTAVARQALYETCVAHNGMMPQVLEDQPAGTTQGRLSSALRARLNGLSAKSGLETPSKRLGLSGASLARAKHCLASAIYFEARGEPLDGQIAVGQVVLNRVFTGFYPDDVCAVVYQNAGRFRSCQFTFACDGTPLSIKEPEAWTLAETMASELLSGALYQDQVAGATHFHAIYVHPVWTKEMQEKAKFGSHIFYRPKQWP